MRFLLRPMSQRTMTFSSGDSRDIQCTLVFGTSSPIREFGVDVARPSSLIADAVVVVVGDLATELDICMYMYVCMYIHIYIYIYTCIIMYVLIHCYIYIERERERLVIHIHIHMLLRLRLLHLPIVVGLHLHERSEDVLVLVGVLEWVEIHDTNTLLCFNIIIYYITLIIL